MDTVERHPVTGAPMSIGKTSSRTSAGGSWRRSANDPIHDSKIATVRAILSKHPEVSFPTDLAREIVGALDGDWYPPKPPKKIETGPVRGRSLLPWRR